MRRGGVAAVSELGVLGDPTTATAAEGARLFAEMVDGCVTGSAMGARRRRDAGMTQPRLPDGFAVQVDRRVKVLGEGSALLGGSPTRLLRLAPAAGSMLDGGRLEVHDAVSAQLARTLLDAAVAHPRPASGPSHRDVTVVIPVRDNVSGLRRLVAALRGMRVVVVDDGSGTPSARRAPARALRRPGGAACAQQGARRRPQHRPGGVHAPTSWHSLTPMSCRGAVGWKRYSVISAIRPSRWSRPGSSTCATAKLVARYEAVRSSLDLGQREAPVVPYGTVSYVPSAAIICRRSALTEMGGFDETLQCGEDVDLCWRFIEVGRPAALRADRAGRSRSPVGVREWLARKAFYGRSAAPLSVRHPDKTAPLVISGWTLVVWMLMAMGSGIGYLASGGDRRGDSRRIARSLSGAETKPRDVVMLAARGLGRLRCNWPRQSAGTIGRSRCCSRSSSGGAARSCWSPRWSTAWRTG